MRNERFIELRQLQKSGELRNWPTYYVITDTGSYEYTIETFVRNAVPREAITMPAPTKYLGTTIVDIHGDGESAVIRLDTNDLIVFNFVPISLEPTIESASMVRFVSKNDAQSWQDEYDSMEPLCV